MALFGSKKKTAPAKKAAKKAVAAKKATASADVEGRLERLLGKPRITEKATYAIANACYVFEVPNDATKSEIKKAIVAVYKVTPRKVTVVSMAPRKTVSRMRNRNGISSGLKKAMVFLKKDEKIDLI